MGHAVFNDLKAGPPIINPLFWYLTVFDLQALLLSHPFPLTRDTQQFAYKYKLSKGRRPALRNLTAQEFGIQIQGGEHSSVRLILSVQRARPLRVFTFVCRLQTLGPQWRYTVSTAANGKRGSHSSYHRPGIPMVRTPPEDPGNGSVQSGNWTTIHPAAGRKV